MEYGTSGAGGFMTGFSNGFSKVRDRKAMLENQAAEREAMLADRAAAREALYADRAAERDAMLADRPAYAREPVGYGGGGQGADGRTSGKHTNYTPMQASDPVNTTLTPQQRAFLNSISANESAGKYNVRYTPHGGELFDLSGGHPRIYEPGPAGKSSAAGRYQFTWSTWKDIAGADTPFTPENQDKYAWALATRNYRTKTGRDLDADLMQGGMTKEIASVLTPTWQGLGVKYGKTAATYADSLARYLAPPPPTAGPAQGRSLLTQNPADYPIGQPL
jgi:muramidase (phage lysozyme)